MNASTYVPSAYTTRTQNTRKNEPAFYENAAGERVLGMSFLPSFFITVQLCCHIYLFWNLQRGFELRSWRFVVAGVLLAGFLMVAFRPKLVEFLDNPLLGKAIFLWAGFLLIVTILTGGRDLMHFAAWGIDRFGGTALSARIPLAASIRLALAAGVLAFGYSLYEASAVRIRHLAIATERLSPEAGQVRIAALSDLHLFRDTSAAWVERIVRQTNAQNPDIVVLLGDIVDDRLDRRPDLLTAVRGLTARHGKFAILGNHEQYRGLEASTAFLEQAGFAVLRGEVRVVAGVALAGVDDPVIRGRRSIGETLADAPGDHFVVLLAHRPETPAEARGRFDLQLSGHTHGGQIWPLALFTRLQCGYWSGVTRLAGGERDGGRPGLLYISRGVGHKNPPVRFLAPPEITVVDVTSVK